MATQILRFINIVIAALLAGTSFGIWIGFNPLHLSQSTYLEQQQNMILSLKTLMVSLVVIATSLTAVSAFFQRKNKAVFISLIMASICFIVCILVTKFGNVPIDNFVMTWTAQTMPANWTEFRDKWWEFHIIRTIAELVALILVAWSASQSKALE